MPVLRLIRERFAREQPLKGMRISACLHVTTETANLAHHAQGRRRGSACSAPAIRSPRRTTWPPALVGDYGIPTFAIKGEDEQTYYRHIDAALDHKPADDDGRRLRPRLARCTKTAPDLIPDVIGGTEETTTGVIRLRSMEKNGVLQVPGHRRQRAETKHSSTTATAPARARIDGIIRATNMLLAGTQLRRGRLRLVRQGRGHARARHGRQRDRHRGRPGPRPRGRDGRLPRHADGEAAPIGDIFVTVTGNINVIDRQHFERMKDGAMIANSGHFNVEINIPALEKLATGGTQMRARLRRGVHATPTARKLYVLAEGRLVNLAAAEGPPGQRDGHELRQPGARRGVHARRTPADARAARSTPSPPTSTTRSRGSSSRRWASTSTRSPPSRSSTSAPGSQAPSLNVRL